MSGDAMLDAHAHDDEHPPIESTDSTTEVPTATLGRSAGVLALGSLAGRVLGLARELVIAWIFGPSGEVSAFRIAAQVPTLLYDFLVGGMLSAALVPVLSTYTGSRREFARVAGALLTLFALLLVLLVVVLEVLAEPLAWLLAAGFLETNPQLFDLTVHLLRWTAPAVWLFCMAGLLTATLYALQRFSFPAIATAVYNLGIVALAPLLAPLIGVTALAAGILLGATAQLAILSLDLRRAGMIIRPVWAWRHPALRQMLRLYVPIAAGLVVSMGQIAIDRRLASGTGEQSIAWMANATTLQQMPLGLISVAIALAALPRLSQFFVQENEAAFRHTLGQGLRLVLLLIAPAGVGLWMLGRPLIELIFEHGRFDAADTVQVSAALRIYVIGMLFAAIDFPLNYAFYARKNTLLPALVGVASVGVYLVVAFALLETLGFLGLVWADTAKQAGHALIIGGLLLWRIGPLRAGFVRGVLQVGLGCAALAGTLWAVQTAVHMLGIAGLTGNVLLLGLGGALGTLVYGTTLTLLGMDEVHQVTTFLRQRLFRRA